MEIKPSAKYLVSKALKLSLTNIWRNKFLSLATIVVIGTIIFIFNIILAINFIAQDSLDSLSKKIDLVVYLKDTTTYDEAIQISDEIKNLDGVTNVTYTSKEDALSTLKKTNPDLSLAFEKYSLGNPLPASLNVSTVHPRYHESVNSLLSQEKYKAYLSGVTTNDTESGAIINSVSKNLLKLTNFAQQTIFWLFLIFIVGGILITINALQITIFTRKKEIEVMKLVGASYWFIRLPFIIEGAVYGVAAVAFSALMLFALNQKLGILTLNTSNTYLILLAEVVITVGLTVLSSIIAVHEHLREKL